MEMNKMLGLSTGHIKEETAGWINGQLTKVVSEIVVYKKDSYGWFIPVSDELESGDIPLDLLKIMNYAQENNYEWIMFDCDIEISKEFEVYDW